MPRLIVPGTETATKVYVIDNGQMMEVDKAQLEPLEQLSLQSQSSQLSQAPAGQGLGMGEPPIAPGGYTSQFAANVPPPYVPQKIGGMFGGPVAPQIPTQEEQQQRAIEIQRQRAPEIRAQMQARLSAAKEQRAQEEARIAQTQPAYSPYQQAPTTSGFGGGVSGWGQYMQAAGAQKEALIRQTQAQIAQNEEFARLKDEEMLQKQQAYDKQQKENEARQQIYTQQMTKLDEDYAEIDAYKEDPNRLFHNMGGFKKILMVLLSGVSGAGAGMSGQPNYAIQAINSAIDRDISAQRAELAKKEKKAERTINKLGLLTEKWGNEDTANQVLRTQYQELVKDRAEKIALTTNNPIIKAQNEAVVAQLDKDVAASKIDLNMKMLQFAKDKPIPVYAGMRPQDMSPEQLQLYVPATIAGQPDRMAFTPKDSEDIKKAQDAAAKIISSTDQLKQYYAIGKEGETTWKEVFTGLKAGSPLFKEHALAEAKLVEMRAAIKKLNELGGALNEKEFDRLMGPMEAKVGPMQMTIKAEKNLDLIDQLQSQVLTDVQNIAKSRSYELNPRPTVGAKTERPL